MSNLSNNIGRAYEYVCLTTLRREILKYRDVAIIENSSFIAAQNAWNSIDIITCATLETSANAAVATLFDMEPLILENDSNCLDLYIQPDSRGEAGDVRDIIIVRKNIQWEIGLSIKHNHFAVKHSRLSEHLDFAKSWFGIPCSQQYWHNIAPIFSYLHAKISQQVKWRDLPAKDKDVYAPLLTAFVNEVKDKNEHYDGIPEKMVEYLLGEFDFYKVISIDNKKLTQIQTYNLRGSLNKPNGKNKPKIIIPIASLPKRIVAFDFKPDSLNTVELYMDGGWQFSFRIHNASTLVEASLKFDIQIIGMPATIVSINCKWNGY